MKERTRREAAKISVSAVAAHHLQRERMVDYFFIYCVTENFNSSPLHLAMP
jgi:hypothetical protein